MEYITMTITTTFSRQDEASTFDKLWIGQEEISIDGRSISQCIEEMYRQGWNLILSRATANLHGIRCEYEFQRTIVMPQDEAIGEVARYQ